MVEQKFSLELTKNGIQQTIYAKEGEAHARALKITLTVKGEVIPLTDYAITAYFDDGTQLPVTPAENPVTFEIPAGLCESPGERIVELQFTRNEGAVKVYSPQFSVIVEDTIGATAEGGAIGDPTQFEKLLASDTEVETPALSARVPLVESDATKLIPANYFATASDVSGIGSRLTTAESDIGDIETALTSKADTSTVNTALADKVDKVSGKGLSTNDYDATEKANVADNTSARHTHSNKTVLDKFGETAGKPTYNGDEIGGGTIADVQDEQGNSLVNEGIATIPSEVVELLDGSGNLKYSIRQIFFEMPRAVMFYRGQLVISKNTTATTPIRYQLHYIRRNNYSPYNYQLAYAEFNEDGTIVSQNNIEGRWSEQNYTYAELTKLRNIEERAQVNIIEKIKKADGTELPITNKAVTLPEAEEQIQVDYEQSDSTAKDYIKHKPDLSVYALSANLGAVATSNDYDDLDNKPTTPDISGKEDTANKVTSLSSSSTDTEYPSAKCVYDIVGDVESALAALIGGNS